MVTGNDDENDEKLFIQEVLRLNQLHPTVILEVDVATAVQLIAVIQLVNRHPAAAYSESLKLAAGFARRVQEDLAKESPELGRLLEKGWHQVFDVIRAPEGRRP